MICQNSSMITVGERLSLKLILSKTAPNFCMVEFMHIQMPLLVCCPPCELHKLRTAIVNSRPSRDHQVTSWAYWFWLRRGTWNYASGVRTWFRYATPRWLKRLSWLGGFKWHTKSDVRRCGVRWYRFFFVADHSARDRFRRLAFYLHAYSSHSAQAKRSWDSCCSTGWRSSLV